MSKIKREFDLTTESGHCNAMDFLTSDPSLIPSDEMIPILFCFPEVCKIK